MRILAEDTMALVIDFQERLVPVIKNANGLLHNTEILMKGLKALGIPMILTQQYTKGIGMTVPVIAEALGEDFNYMDKVSFSCVDDENIMQRIHATGKKNIIVCGIEAHICVLQTVIDLIQQGFHVILVEDCIGSRKENDTKVAVLRAAAEGAVITTYESILFELTRYAKSDVFKQISALIK
ncbi:hydrolase [Mobilitalea sibirica]|uniref:Hydrolase n=1 Tax=Mobilitalea sibirica TaxID=1462919 RepID=A0A8J7HAM6_9FIRM|nr:hydrolase [Mobilitalea sibirica]MBH1940106.1 hydrolase [Mobilitalea sibirica]